MNLNQNSNVGVFNLSKGENGKAPTVRLSSEYDMPIVGLGTYSLHGDVCVNSVKAALASGFRKIDTAHIYDNEEEVGQGVRESACHVKKSSWQPNFILINSAIPKQQLKNACVSSTSVILT